MLSLIEDLVYEIHTEGFQHRLDEILDRVESLAKQKDERGLKKRIEHNMEKSLRMPAASFGDDNSKVIFSRESEKKEIIDLLLSNDANGRKLSARKHRCSTRGAAPAYVAVARALDCVCFFFFFFSRIRADLTRFAPMQLDSCRIGFDSRRTRLIRPKSGRIGHIKSYRPTADTAETG